MVQLSGLGQKNSKIKQFNWFDQVNWFWGPKRPKNKNNNKNKNFTLCMTMPQAAGKKCIFNKHAIQVFALVVFDGVLKGLSWVLCFRWSVHWCRASRRGSEQPLRGSKRETERGTERIVKCELRWDEKGEITFTLKQAFFGRRQKNSRRKKLKLKRKKLKLKIFFQKLKNPANFP